MINVFGYYFKKLDFSLALFDIIICSMGFFFYAWLGLASNNSTTPQLMSPIFLSFATGVILWGFLFAVGINSLPNIDNISSFFLKGITAFFISIFVIVPLWWLSGFEYDRTPLLTIPAVFIQISILLIMRVVIIKLIPSDIFVDNVLVLSTKGDRDKIKTIIQYSSHKYVIKRCLDLKLLQFPYVARKILSFCQKNNISKVIIGNLKNRGDIIPLIELLYKGIEIIDVDSFQEQHIGKINIERFYNYNTLINRSFMPSRLNSILKRAFDIIISLLLLIVLFPLMILIAILIKSNDGGSVFYFQKRVGHHGRIFNILKFRSMRVNAEKDGVQWAVANDSRITKVGRFIRKTRIDELPQLINILKNDMSIVGPRPERPEFVADLNKKLLYYNERHRIKPGLTGWAQISVGYAASIDDAREKLEYDLYYLKYFNPSLDLLIVLKTISVVLWPEKVH